MPDYRIHVFELATGNDIDGLLGLSFLNELNYEVRSKEGRPDLRGACGSRP